MEEVHLNKEVSAEMLLKALEKAARDSGGELVSSGQGSFGGRKIIVLGSAREEISGTITTFRPRVEIPLPDFPDKSLAKTRLVLSFEDERWLMRGNEFLQSFPSWDLRAGKIYSNIRMNVLVTGEWKLWSKMLFYGLMLIPFVGWLALAVTNVWPGNNRYEYNFNEEAKVLVKTAYMNYLNRLGEALKA